MQVYVKVTPSTQHGTWLPPNKNSNRISHELISALENYSRLFWYVMRSQGFLKDLNNSSGRDDLYAYICAPLKGMSLMSTLQWSAEMKKLWHVSSHYWSCSRVHIVECAEMKQLWHYWSSCRVHCTW